MGEFDESKTNRDQIQRLEAMQNRLAPLLDELPELDSWVKRDEHSPQSQRLSAIREIESAIHGWLQYLQMHGLLPEDQEVEILGELEAELERLEKG